MSYLIAVLVVLIIEGFIMKASKPSVEPTEYTVSDEVQDLIDGGAPQWVIDSQMMREDMEQSRKDIDEYNKNH